LNHTGRWRPLTRSSRSRDKMLLLPLPQAPVIAIVNGGEVWVLRRKLPICAASSSASPVASRSPFRKGRSVASNCAMFFAGGFSGGNATKAGSSATKLPIHSTQAIRGGARPSGGSLHVLPPSSLRRMTPYPAASAAVPPAATATE
jgi:hypothetical protein